MKGNGETRMIDQAIDRLAADLDAGRSEQLKAYLQFMGRFHRYSLGNLLMISVQRPSATRVAGFHTWNRLGRRVKAGERAIRILAPIRRTIEEEGEEVEKVVAFRSVCVFDISQTAGKDPIEFPKVTGEPGRFLERLQEFAARRRVELTYTNRIGRAQGASAGGRIYLRKDLAPADHFSTLVHELAHELLHQEESEENAGKTVRETEAEAVAFVVCSAVGLETNTASSDYIQLYDGDRKTLMASLSRIRNVAAEIIPWVQGRDEEAGTMAEGSRRAARAAA